MFPEVGSLNETDLSTDHTCVWAEHKSQNSFSSFFLIWFFFCLLIFSLIMCWCITFLGTGLIPRALSLSCSFAFACVRLTVRTITHGCLLNSHWMQQLCMSVCMCISCILIIFIFKNNNNCLKLLLISTDATKNAWTRKKYIVLINWL